MRSLTSSRPAWSASRTSLAPCGSSVSSLRFDHGTAISQSRYVRIIDASPLASPIVSRRRSSRSACARTSSGIPASSIFVAVLVDDRALVLAELLADRVHLLAEEPLALLLLRALLDVVADAAPHLQLGEPLALELEGELQPLDDVDRLEQLDALREA